MVPPRARCRRAFINRQRCIIALYRVDRAHRGHPAPSTRAIMLGGYIVQRQVPRISTALLTWHQTARATERSAGDSQQ